MPANLIIGVNNKLASCLAREWAGENHLVYGLSRKCSEKTTYTDVFEYSLSGNKVLINQIKKFNALHFQNVVFLNGMLLGKSLLDISEDEAIETVNANFIITMLICRYLLKRCMVSSSIIFMSSISAQNGSYDPIYSASKCALEGFGRSLAKAKTIKPNIITIAPGLIEGSSMYEKFSENELERHLSETPTGKFLQIEELSKIIMDVCKPNWVQLNGQVLHLNGGRRV